MVPFYILAGQVSQEHRHRGKPYTILPIRDGRIDDMANIGAHIQHELR